jgi:diguanylate cyclase (GGDEF)-like protein
LFESAGAGALVNAPPVDDGGADRLSHCAWLVARTVAAPIAVVWRLDGAEGRIVSSWGVSALGDMERAGPLSRSLAAQVASGCARAISVADVDVDAGPVGPEARAALEALGARAYAAVPLRMRSGQCAGVLFALDTAPRAWSSEDVLALHELAALITAQLEATARAAAYASAAGGESVLFGADGITPLPAAEHPFTRALCGETVTQAECFVRLPNQQEGRWHRINATPLRDPQGVVRGAIVVGSDVTEQRLAQERLAQTVETLRMLALLDELTGLHNRRGFTALAEQQFRMAQQAGRSLLIFFADLDELKAINDTHGHDAGDQALRDAARLLRATFRESDLLARIGGDEFVVLACDATRADADLFAARLQAALRAYNALARRGFTLSISTGATAYDPRVPEPLDALLARADAAMYRDKRLRRTTERPALR